MIIKDSNKRILFNSTKEAINSNYTDDELQSFRDYHLVEVKSYNSVHDFNHAMEHATQAQFCREAIQERNKPKLKSII